MVRFNSPVRTPRRAAGADSLHAGRKLLRRLCQENLTLLRELEELRAIDLMARAYPGAALLSGRQFEQRLVLEMARSLTESTGGGALLLMNLNTVAPSAAKVPVRRRDDRPLPQPPGSPLDGAELIAGVLRAPDVCCRAGGHDYLVLLPAADPREAHLIMARLRTAAIREGARHDLAITLSMGWACWPADAQNPVDLVKLVRSSLAAEKRRLRSSTRRRPPTARVGGTLALVR